MSEAALPASTFEVQNVHTITLPHFEPELPWAPGRAEFQMVCVSCHSPRYVTMQPPFDEHQWEATVTKMTKVFGAPMDEEQKKAIVGYLVASNGINGKKALAKEDDEQSASGIQNSESVETFPEIHLPTMRDQLAAGVKRGDELFQNDCAGCHGKEGKGDGVISPVLLPKPANLTAAAFSSHALSQVLWDGVRGTAMPAWRSLPRQDLEAVAAYVQTLHTTDKASAVAGSADEAGKKLFQANCAACHGATGDGKTAVAATLSPAPASFKWKQADLKSILTVLEAGIPGTAMPSWKEQLSETNRMVVAEYVRSLYAP